MYDDAAVRVELESRVEPYRVFVGVVVDEESVGLVVQREGVAVRRQCAYPSCDVPVDVGRREAVFSAGRSPNRSLVTYLLVRYWPWGSTQVSIRAL